MNKHTEFYECQNTIFVFDRYNLCFSFQYWTKIINNNIIMRSIQQSIYPVTMVMQYLLDHKKKQLLLIRQYLTTIHSNRTLFKQPVYSA